MGQAAQTLVELVPLTTYVLGNFKETQVGAMAEGQPATFTVDAFGDHVFRGRIDSFAPGTGAQFALLPPENATGNFTKIVQRVPVRIRVEGDAIRQGALRPGLSVVTYVNIKGAGEAGGAVAAPAKSE